MRAYIDLDAGIVPGAPYVALKRAACSCLMQKRGAVPVSEAQRIRPQVLARRARIWRR